jgi:phosphoribosylformimino-5-aminoimidazole carboxamide ribotide isomerase
MIVFPAIDLRQGRCVRLRQGRAEDETVYGDDPSAVARAWVAQGAQWLHVVNLDGAFGGAANGALAGPASDTRRPVNLERLVQIRAAVPDTPLQFGGGLRSLEDVDTALELGATRVILGTVAVRNPELVAEALRRFGPERIVVGIDAREGRVATHGWQQTSNVTATALGQAMRDRGVTTVVYTDIARDGMLTGLNVQATADLARTSGLRVIASGGVASLDDIVALQAAQARQAHCGSAGRIEGVIVGQALYTGALSLLDAIEAVAASPKTG